MFLVIMMVLGGSAPVDYRMIRPTVVYDEDIGSADEWLGFFEMAGSWMLRPVEVQFTLEDGVFYEGERPAGLIVDLPGENYSTPLVLISSSVPVFSTGQVLTVVHDYMHLLPNLTVVFSERELEEVTLFTNGDGLYLSTDEIEQHITGTYPGEEGSETYMGILWAGDLDRDGKLDFLLNDVAHGYRRFSWDLYLSTEASPDQLVGKVATFYDTYY